MSSRDNSPLSNAPSSRATASSSSSSSASLSSSAANEPRDYLTLTRAVSDLGVFARLGDTPAARMLALSAAAVRRREIIAPLFSRSGAVRPSSGVGMMANQSQQYWRSLWFANIGRRPTFRSEQLLLLTLRRLPSVIQHIKRREVLHHEQHRGKVAMLPVSPATVGSLPTPPRKSAVSASASRPATVQPPASEDLLAHVGSERVVVAGEGAAEWPRMSLFLPTECSRIFDTNSQYMSQSVVDRTTAYCHLCREPVHNVAMHAGYWDHVTRVVALRMCVAFRRCTTLASPPKSTTASRSPDSGADEALRTRWADEAHWCPQRVLTGVVVDLRLPTERAAMWAPSFWQFNQHAQWALYGHLMSHFYETTAAASRFPKLLPFVPLDSQRPDLMMGAADVVVVGQPIKRFHANQQAAIAAAASGGCVTRQPPSAVVAAPTAPFAIPALMRPDSVRRLQELQALLKKFCHWGLLTFCFSGPERPGIANEGERCFRATVSSLLTPMMFPLSAQGQTRWCQKMWGRQSLEMLFDALDLANAVQHTIFGVPMAAVAKTKNQKAAVMRQMVYQLHSVADASGRHVVEDTSLNAAASCAAPQSPPPTPSKRGAVALMTEESVDHSSSDSFCCFPQLPPPPESVLVTLSELALHRIAFELIHIRTSVLMDDASGAIWADLGFPTAGEAGDAMP
jgi:hypothetical protein